MAGRGSSWAEPAANVIKLFSFVCDDLAKKAKVISRESILSKYWQGWQDWYAF
jgi:hypothetical protein